MAPWLQVGRPHLVWRDPLPLVPRAEQARYNIANTSDSRGGMRSCGSRYVVFALCSSMATCCQVLTCSPMPRGTSAGPVGIYLLKVEITRIDICLGNATFAVKVKQQRLETWDHSQPLSTTQYGRRCVVLCWPIWIPSFIVISLD